VKAFLERAFDKTLDDVLKERRREVGRPPPGWETSPRHPEFAATIMALARTSPAIREKLTRGSRT